MPPQLESFVFDASRLPYPVAITAQRLIDAGDVHWKLSYCKDCFEATIRFCATVLIADYFGSSVANRDRDSLLLAQLSKPAIGGWVQVVEDLSRWLIEAAPKMTVGCEAASSFVRLPQQKGSKPKPTKLLTDCKSFVSFRNESVYGHAASQSPAAYEQELGRLLPILSELLDCVARLAKCQLCLVTNIDHCSVWMGIEPGNITRTGRFTEDLCGHFVLVDSTDVEAEGAANKIIDLFPFLCDLPDRGQQDRLCYYDSIHRYDLRRKEVKILGYGTGQRCVSAVPISGLERCFTPELVASTFIKQQGRMEIIEGRVAGFGELIVEHATIVGRKFVIDYVKQFIEEHDRGLLVIEAQPGKGKTALMCHLIEDVFGDYTPSPIRFFYRRTAGITDPDICVRTIYDELLNSHELSESDDMKKEASPERMVKKLGDLLNNTIAPKLSPSRPQLILIDALDEAEKTASGKDAFQRIPESLPAGVFVIVTTRRIQKHRTRLTNRNQTHWYDLDHPDLVQNNLRDGDEFVRRELKDCRVPSETVKEIARIGAGNFLALKLLVNHVRRSGDPGSVNDLLQRIATEPTSEHLGFIFEEFWERLTGRLELHEIQILCDVAGLLVTARCPLSAEMICECLRLSSAVWDFALRKLLEYLTVIELDEDGERQTYFRVYHESFAEFLRAKISHDLHRLKIILADYCRHWNDHAPGHGRLYSLRFGPEHLISAAEHDRHRWTHLEKLLTDIFFLEAKSQAGFVAELATDFISTWQAMPSDRPLRPILLLLGEVIRREADFIADHAVDYPQGLFQCVWNSAWWYGNPEVGKYYLRENQTNSRKEKGAKVESPAQSRQLEVGIAMVQLLERWRIAKESVDPGFHWLRSLRPPASPLGGAQLAVIPANRGGGEWVDCTADGKLIAGGDGSSSRIWNASTLDEIKRMPEWEGQHLPLQAVAFSPDGGLLIAACGTSSYTGGKVTDLKSRPLLAAWHTSSREVRTFTHRHKHRITDIAFSRDGSRFATASSDRTIRIWDAKSFEEIRVLRGSDAQVESISWSPDGRRIVAGAAAVRIWDVMSGREVSVFQFDESRGYGFQVRYSPDGSRIAASLDNRSVFILDVQSGDLLARTAMEVDIVDCIRFSPDGERVVYSEQGGRLVVSDARTGGTFCELLGHEGDKTTVCYLPDGKRIVSGSWDGTIRIWAVDSDAPAAILPGVPADETQHIAFLDAGKSILSVSTEGVCIWDGQSGTLLKEFESDAARSRFSKNARRCVQFCPSLDEHPASLEVWEPRTGQVIWKLEWEDRPSCSFDLSPDGKNIGFAETTRGKKYVVRIFDVSSGDELTELRGHDDEINDVRFSANGAQIGTASNDHTAQVWDVATGESLIRIHHKAAVRQVWFSPAGTQIVTFGDGDGFRVFDSDGGIEYVILDQNVQSIYGILDVCFSPDETRILASAAGNIFIWNSRTGKLLEVIAGRGDIQSIAADVEGTSLRLLDRGGDTVIETPAGQIVAQHPYNWWNHIATHPNGRTWAGTIGGYLALIHLEGRGDL